jgi:hypothetical protein
MVTIDTLHDALIEKILENVPRHFLYHNVRLVDRRLHLLAWRVIRMKGEKLKRTKKTLT